MNRKLTLLTFGLFLAPTLAVAQDPVIYWNQTIRSVINDVPATANPGVSTRAIAMMNAAIYDIYQSYDRTHAPFLANATAPQDANLEMAVATAVRDILEDCYPTSGVWATKFSERTTPLVDTPGNLTAGANLGAAVALKYINKKVNDGWNVEPVYTPQVGVAGHWTTDPYFMSDLGPVVTQGGWGPGWGDVKPWTMEEHASYKDHFAAELVDADALVLNSEKYTKAYNQVLNYGAQSVYGPGNTATSRNADQTEIGKFWGYDVPGFGPPPVLFLKNLEDISAQTNLTPAQEARLFALATVAMADAAIASWDVKFAYDFWRPVTAIMLGVDDGNANTALDLDWKPLGAPGHATVAPDFTPPFPAYTSGHATMGGAVFKAMELFYGFNEFELVTGQEFYLTSDELGVNDTRMYERFTEIDVDGFWDDVATDSPEGENAMSRIFLGIHWVFDATDGIRLGRRIAEDAAANFFQAVPEPSSVVLMLTCIASFAFTARRRGT
jgi:hypothetical protein